MTTPTTPDSTRGDIRTHGKGGHSARARVQVSAGERSNGMATTVIRISALDAHDIPEVVATLSMSPTDAAALGGRLIVAATPTPEPAEIVRELTPAQRRVFATVQENLSGDAVIMGNGAMLQRMPRELFEHVEPGIQKATRQRGVYQDGYATLTPLGRAVAAELEKTT